MRYYTTLCSKRKLGCGRICRRGQRFDDPRLAGKTPLSRPRYPGVLNYKRIRGRMLLICVAMWMFSVINGAAAGAPEVQRERFPPKPFLRRPVQANAVSDRPSSFYPYASTGQRRYQVHHGVEFVNPMGTPLVAVAGGTIVVAGADEQRVLGRRLGYYGRVVVIELAQRYAGRSVFALYGHLSHIDVHVGQRVRAGDVIGLVGMSGVALGPHLHFEVRVGQNTFYHTRNPELWFEPLPGYGRIIGRVQDERGRLVEQALLTFHPVERPERYWREAWTYTAVRAERLGVDEFWRENFVLGDVPPGEYWVRVRVDGKLYTRRVAVRAGESAFVLIAANRRDHLPGTGIDGIILQP